MNYAIQIADEYFDKAVKLIDSQGGNITKTRKAIYESLRHAWHYYVCGRMIQHAAAVETLIKEYRTNN